MKPPTNNKLPRARVMWAHPARMIMCRTNCNKDLTQYLVVPLSGPAARRACKFANMDYEQQVRLLARAMYDNERTDGIEQDWDTLTRKRVANELRKMFLDRARSVLALIFGAEGGGR